MRRLDPGEAVALGLVGYALAADVVLIRRDCLPISTCVRRGVVARVVVVYLAAHLLFVLPHDPLSWLGEWVCPRPQPGPGRPGMVTEAGAVLP